MSSGFTPGARQVPREQAQLGSEYGPTPAVDEHEEIGQM
jgi:hypothetical protein